MRISSRKTTIAFFITLGVCVAAATAVLSTSWIILNWREIVPLILGVMFFGFIIAGVILNTIFLVREVRRNEQQDSFLNAVTHELKMPFEPNPTGRRHPPPKSSTNRVAKHP